MFGVISESERQQISERLINKLITKASSHGLKFAFAECTSPKTVRIMEKYFGAEKYIDLYGNHIAYKYKDNDRLRGISASVSDGAYIVVKDFH